MKLPRIFKQRRMRGKSKSPEAKFREKKAQVDGFLLDAWLKQLRNNPELAQRISEQKFGTEAILPQYGDGNYEGQPDLLEVLRQAKEAKALLKGELSESKSSWLSDVAEIMKALPGLLANLPQLQQMAQQAKPVTQRIQTQPEQKQIVQPQPQHLELSMSMEALMPLIVLEPSEALQQLRANNEQGWLQYLSHTSVEEFEAVLAQYAKDCEIPEIAEGINDFLQKKHHWIEELVELAHSTQQN